MLKLLPTFSGAKVVRTRDSAVLDTLPIIVDVGSVYDPAAHRYDHHQKGFTEVLDGFKTKLSSAGLIYRHFGKDVLSAVCPGLSDAQLNLVYRKMYISFVEEMDAVDNGIERFPEGGPAPRFQSNTSLPNRVGLLNQSWNETAGPSQDERFEKAVALTQEEFVLRARFWANSWIPAREVRE